MARRLKKSGFHGNFRQCSSHNPEFLVSPNTNIKDLHPFNVGQPWSLSAPRFKKEKWSFFTFSFDVHLPIRLVSNHPGDSQFISLRLSTGAEKHSLYPTGNQNGQAFDHYICLKNDRIKGNKSTLEDVVSAQEGRLPVPNNITNDLLILFGAFCGDQRTN